jgi:type II secretion system protein I
VKSTRGVTLLEMIVAATILAIAVVGLMAGLAGTTRNAARLQDYDRAVQLGRTRMNELMLDQRMPRNTFVEGPFDPAIAGGLEAGWKARISVFKLPPHPAPGEVAIDRIELQVWWRTGQNVRTYTLDGYRPRGMKADDAVPGAPK